MNQHIVKSEKLCLWTSPESSMLCMQPAAHWDQMTTRGETFLSHESMIAVTAEPSLADKVAFLSRPDSYGEPARMVSRRETHMSWVFLVGDHVFKLKKPVRFAYLDFSTLVRREAACRAE